MRGRLFTVLFTMVGAAVGQSPVINEVVVAGPGPDAIELFNPEKRPIDLAGWTLVLDGISHRLAAPLSVPPKGFFLFVADGDVAAGPNHLPMRLKREGGHLLLIAPDRITVQGVFSWKSLPEGVSIGLAQDGGQVFGYSRDPSPGSSNSGHIWARRCLHAPVFHLQSSALHAEAEDGAQVRYTTDGSMPLEDSPEWTGGLTVHAASIITARSFAADGIPSEPSMFTVLDAAHPCVAICAAPSEFFSDERGILSSTKANYVSHGRTAWRDVRLRMPSGDTTAMMAAEMSVSGSGSRGLPKKSLKLRAAQGRLADAGLGPWQEMILRADASPHAFLRNTFMEVVASQAGTVDVQRSLPLPVYINGAYHGLYRLMPPKNGEWLKARSGAEHIDLIDGAGAQPLSGDRAHFDAWRRALLGNADADSLERLMEVNSLLDLACLDLWTGRADHDLNTRCWRPAERDGRWRWILFDMDLWAPPAEGTVERMCSESAPVAPWLPRIIAHEELRPRLLARMCAWLATSLAADRALLVADSIHRTNRLALERDHQRWGTELDVPTPSESLADLHTHIRSRPQHLLDQLAQRTGHRVRPLSVSVVPAHAGSVSIEGMPLTEEERTFQAFAGVLLTLTAVPNPGYEFVGWSDGGRADARAVDARSERRLKALFKRVSEEEVP